MVNVIHTDTAVSIGCDGNVGSRGSGADDGCMVVVILVVVVLVAVCVVLVAVAVVTMGDFDDCCR